MIGSPTSSRGRSNWKWLRYSSISPATSRRAQTVCAHARSRSCTVGARRLDRPAVWARLVWFPPPRHLEPWVRFSRTRLHDVLHRRHSASPARPGWAGGCDDDSGSVDPAQAVRGLDGQHRPAVASPPLVALGHEQRGRAASPSMRASERGNGRAGVGRGRAPSGGGSRGNQSPRLLPVGARSGYWCPWTGGPAPPRPSEAPPGPPRPRPGSGTSPRDRPRSGPAPLAHAAASTGRAGAGRRWRAAARWMTAPQSPPPCGVPAKLRVTVASCMTPARSIARGSLRTLRSTIGSSIAAINRSWRSPQSWASRSPSGSASSRWTSASATIDGLTDLRSSMVARAKRAGGHCRGPEPATAAIVRAHPRR